MRGQVKIMRGLRLLVLWGALGVGCAHAPPTPHEGPPADPDAFRATPPAVGAIRDVAVPEVERFTLSNGLEGYFLPNATLPTLAMTFEFDRGQATDPPNKIGLSSVCMDLFSEGTRRLDKVAWSEALADHALQIYSPAGVEVSQIEVRALVSELEPTLGLLAELLASPGMRQADFKRIIADRKAMLEQGRANPSAIAQRLASALVWGPQHAYGRVGLERHLRAMTLRDCQAWVQDLKPRGARLWVTGQIEREALVAALEAHLGSWQGTVPAQAPLRQAAAAWTPGVYAVQVPGAAQTVVTVLSRGPARTAPDYAATYLMAQIYGGTFTSRINMNLREDKGYAYGASGRFTYRRLGTSFASSASVEASTAGLAIDEIAKEIAKMRSEDVSQDELQRARDGALLALPARFATPAETLDALRSLAFLGLPLNWYAGWRAQLEAVDVNAVRTAAEAHLAPADSGVVIFVVGDLNRASKGEQQSVAAHLTAAMKAGLAGGGEIHWLDPDGEAVKRPRWAP